jgi:hypothetical protein
MVSLGICKVTASLRCHKDCKLFPALLALRALASAISGKLVAT